jgi:hypothetical protein
MNYPFLMLRVAEFAGSDAPSLLAHLELEVAFDPKHLHRIGGAEPLDQSRAFGDIDASLVPAPNYVSITGIIVRMGVERGSVRGVVGIISGIISENLVIAYYAARSNC